MGFVPVRASQRKRPQRSRAPDFLHKIHLSGWKRLRRSCTLSPERLLKRGGNMPDPPAAGGSPCPVQERTARAFRLRFQKARVLLCFSEGEKFFSGTGKKLFVSSPRFTSSSRRALTSRRAISRAIRCRISCISFWIIRKDSKVPAIPLRRAVPFSNAQLLLPWFFAVFAHSLQSRNGIFQAFASLQSNRPPPKF